MITTFDKIVNDLAQLDFSLGINSEKETILFSSKPKVGSSLLS